MPDPILAIRDLTVEFNTEDGVVQAVTDVSYDLMPGEVLGIVGESGSGKSVSMLSILGLSPQGRIPKGEAIFKGRDLLKLSQKQLRDIRGGDMAMIFQDPMTSLNPVLTVGNQIGEALLVAQRRDERRRREEACDRAARGRGRPLRRAADRPVPARVLGRHAPARDDRDGDGEQPERADRRRADDRSGRDDPGADRRGAEGRAGGDARRHRPDHPRPRPDRRARRPSRRHVRRPGRRARGRVHDLQRAPPSRTRSA